MLAVVAAAVGGFYWGRTGLQKPPAVPATPALPGPEASSAAEPGVHYPIPEAEEDATPDAAPSAHPASATAARKLPALDESDPTFLDELARIFGRPRLEALFYLNDLIRRITVSVNAADEPKPLSLEFSLTRPASGQFLTLREGDAQVIDPRNYARYAPYVSFLQDLDVKRVAALYTRFYPLFQAAYRELGLKGYFNDRLVQAIDDVLKTPDLTAPPHVFPVGARYKYVDYKLESLPTAQKALLRMGPENAARIKGKLRELRARLIRH